LTLDNKKVLVPNGDLMNATITNYSAEPIRRVDVDYKITNDANAEQVKQVLLEACAKSELILAEPAPFTRMTAVDDDTYIFTVRGWCKTADYWDAYFNMIENCSKALQDNGIDDPEERIVVRLQKED
jgi:small conductance mechanosensitive channel